MATKSSCLPHLLVEKLLKHGKPLENNNYIFPKRSSSASSKKTCNNNDLNSKPELSRLATYILVASVSVLVYMNSLHGDFVHDDVVAIRNNADVTGPSTSLQRIFTNDFWGRPIVDKASHKSYRPLCVLSFRLNYLVGGLEPEGYHLVNVLLHALCCLLLTHLCEHVLLYSTHLSALAGLLFATHPIHTEAVAGVVGRADVMACALYLITFLLYHRSVHVGKSAECPLTGSPLHLYLALISAGAAMLVKEHGITVLGVCLLYDIFIINRASLTRFLTAKAKRRTCLPFVKRILLVSLWLLLLMTVRVWMMGGQPPSFRPEDNPAAAADCLLQRLLTHVYVYSLNAWLLIFPLHLSYDWQMGSVPLVNSLTDTRNLFSLAFLSSLAALSAMSWYKVKGVNQKRLMLALWLLIIPFIPASNLLFPVGFVIAERILYIPSLGFVLLLLFGLERLSVRPHRGGVGMFYCCLLLCGAWAGRTVSRNTVWTSRQALFRSGLHVLPDNAKMHYNYGNYMKDMGEKGEAMKHYKEAIRLWPEYASAHNNLGTLANVTSEAEWHYRRAIAINPRHAGAYFNLGNLLSQENEVEEAISALQEAIQVDPYFPDPHSSLAVLLDGIGRHSQAENHYRTVVKLRPQDANAFNNLGVFLGNQGKGQEALQAYKMAYTVDENHYLSMVNAARQLRHFHNSREAQALLERALSLSRDRMTLSFAGVFYFNTEQPGRAAILFKELLSHPHHTSKDAIYYAQALSRLGRHKEAEKVLRDVTCRHHPGQAAGGHPEALHQLANVLGLRKKHKEALDVLTKIIAISDDSNFLAKIYNQMGNHHKDMGNMNLAFQCYSKAVKLDMNIGEAHLNLGVFHHLKDNLIEARYHYLEAHRLLPQSELVRENLTKLCRIDALSPYCQETYT